MTSVVGVYLLSGSARLVHMWVSVCVQACLVGREQEWGGNGITALCPECCCRPRGEEGEICIKTKFFEGWAVLNRPITTRPRVRNYSPPFERARCSKKWPLRFISMKEVRRENVTRAFLSFFNPVQSTRLCSSPVLLSALASHSLVLLLRTVHATPEQREPVWKMWARVSS